MSEKSEKGTRDPVLKALAILRRFMEEPTRQFGIRETAADMGLSPSSSHRLLNALASNGFIARQESGLFALSADVIRLSNLVVSQVPVQTIAMRHMKILWQSNNELIFLGNYSPERQEMFFSDYIESTQEFPYRVKPVNSWVPVYSGASGLAVMAFLPKSDRDAIIERTKLKPLTALTIADPEELDARLAEIRKEGYAYTHGQRIVGAVGVAAPIFDARGQVVGSITLSVPEQRFDEARLGRYIQGVKTCAGNITSELGGAVLAADDAIAGEGG